MRSSPLTALRRNWWVGAILAIAGLVAGVVFARSQPVDYTAEARVAVGSQDLSAYAVPGYALAAQQLAADYSRYVSTDQARPGLLSALGKSAANVSSVSASPIPDSSIIRVEASANSRDLAVRASAQVAQALITQINDSSVSNDAADTLAAFTALGPKIADAQNSVTSAQTALSHLRSTGATQSQITAAQQAVVTANSQLASLQVQQSALSARYSSLIANGPAANHVSLVSAAAPTGSNRTSREERYGLAGLVLGVVLALIAVVAVDTRSVQRRPGQPHSLPPREDADGHELALDKRGGAAVNVKPVPRDAAARR